MTRDPEDVSENADEGLDDRVERDVPWWVGDPAMQQRLRRLD